MSRRPRRNHSPVFKAKVAIAAINDQVRGGLPARLRERQRGARGDRPLSRSLQSPPPAFEP